MENIIVFGRGHFFRENIGRIERDYNIIAFIDNAAESDIAVNIYNPKDINLAQSGKILVMAYSFIEVVKQLLDAGVDKTNILIGLNYYGLSDKDAERSKIGKFEITDEGIVFNSDLTGCQKIEEASDIARLDNLIIRKKKPLMFDIDKIGIKPIDSTLGYGRGYSISRYYIDYFIELNQKYIKGNVMEIGDSRYTEKYGANKVQQQYVLHINGGENCIKGDLQTGEGIEEEIVDCFILTQTLDFLFDLKSSCQNIVKALKKNGVALVTVAGISQISRYDMDRWGHYWCFTDMSLKKLFADIVGEENVQIQTFGNVKSAMLRLYGACKEDMRIEDLNICDRDYQVIIGAVVRKP